LSDVLNFTSGKSVKPGGEGPFPVYGSNGTIGGTSEPLHEEGIVIGRVGAYCGSLELPKLPFWASDNTIVAKPRRGDLDLRFAFYALSNLRLNRWAGGSAQPLLTQTVLREVPILIPVLELQLRVVRILSAYDDLIENNQRRIEILEEMARLLYREWFVHFRFPGHEDVVMVDSRLGRIPEGWEVGPLDRLVANIRRSAKPGVGLHQHPYIPIDCISARSMTINKTKPGAEAKSSLLLFEAGDILFGAMRPYFHKVAVAPEQGVTRATCFVLRPRQEGWHSYCLLTLFRDETVAFATSSSRGTTIPYAVWDGSMPRLPVLLPPDDLMGRLESVVRPQLQLAQTLVRQNANLRAARDLLLPKLVSGQLDCSELDIEGLIA